MASSADEPGALLACPVSSGVFTCGRVHINVIIFKKKKKAPKHSILLFLRCAPLGNNPGPIHTQTASNFVQFKISLSALSYWYIYSIDDMRGLKCTPLGLEISVTHVCGWGILHEIYLILLFVTVICTFLATSLLHMFALHVAIECKDDVSVSCGGYKQ